MRKRIEWIDTARGLAMAAILLLHTEIYYTGRDIISYGLYVENALMTFFFVSGYLFHGDSGFSLRHKMVSILRGIVMPYFIFTSAMALPKAIAHNNLTSFTDIATGIVCGRASWFVTALAVAEVLFAAAVYLSVRFRSAPVIPALCAISLATAVYAGSSVPQIWNTDIALMAVAYLYMGYIYRRHEEAVNRRIHPGMLLPAAAILASLKWYEYSNGLSMLVFPLDITSYPVFFADTITSLVLIVSLAKALPAYRLISFMGRNSIVYYFLSGGIPLITAACLNRAGMPYDGNYLRVIIALVIVYAATTAATWAVMRYIPFVTGRKYKTLRETAEG